MMPAEPNTPVTNAGSRPPSISVVIPAYNAGRFLGAAIDSVLQQTLPPLEIIVIDDGSTDDTRDRLRVYENQIQYFFQTNQGIGIARNVGISRARGDWIALLDADDIWHPHKLESQWAVIVRHPDVALIGTTAFCIDATGARLPGEYPEPTRRDLAQISLRQMIDPGVFCPSAVIIRKSVLETIGGFSTQVQGSEDMLMWWSIAGAYPVLHLRAALTGYRFHPSSISSRYQTMIDSKKRALAIALATVPAFQTHWWLRCVGRSRIYRDTSWERHQNGDHWGAIADLLISIVNRPSAIRNLNGNKLHGWRVRQLCHYVLAVFHHHSPDGD